MDDLNLSETTCDRDYSEYPLIVEPFRQILIETANSAVSSVELVDDSVKSTVLLGFPLVAILTLITFISHVFVPEMVPLLPVIAGLNIFVLPLSVFVLFAPIVAKAGSISLIGEVRIEEGMHAAMELFFLQIVYLILLATNAFPVAELQVTEEEVKEVAAEEAMSLI